MKQKIGLKWGTLISSLFFVSVVAISQPIQGRGPHHGGHGDRMPDSCRAKCMIDDLSKVISLSDVQKQKISEIHAAHFKQMKDEHEQDSICMARNWEKHQQMRTEMDNEVKQILTDDQKTKYDAYMAEKRVPHKGQSNKK
jgi:hypothetical protein